MPLQRRLPKRGFRNYFKKEFSLVHVKDLERFEPNSIIDVDALLQAGLIGKLRDGVTVLSDGEITRPVTLRVHRVSRKAREKIESAGGKVEEIYR
jgi:large subunit ribosomal protein L15